MSEDNTNQENQVEQFDGSQEPQEIVQDELATLKERADKLGVTYHPSIKLEKLKEKVAAALIAPEMMGTNTLANTVAHVIEKDEVADPATLVDTSANKPSGDGAIVAPEPFKAPVADTEAQARAKKRKRANELIRIRVVCMNPAKSEWPGEIFTVGNSLVGSIKKYVPFNSDEGWHVPRMIYEVMKGRECQVFVQHKNSNGVVSRKGKMIKEFAMEVLDPLTQAELDELARRQALGRTID